MKHIVTKRSYKVGACAMALALLMTTAGGAVVNANTDVNSNTEQSLTSKYGFSDGGGKNNVLLERKEQTESFNHGVGDVESINYPSGSQMDQSSWFGSFWKGVQRLWNALCGSVGLTWCKVQVK
ncbi:TPA: hypothetical protein TZM76_000791 [Streptococcus suis]|uniref:Uncharacterized protein n=1 Tax=Streptococcus suis D12 TaxID=1004952 RepID=G7SE57_STRSU|nr:hypothetical protein [Streptococcus suis]AER19526.1 hypothetical protein SSUD12_1236 [Streptococcus suis D12]MCK4022139.1 hypothetical protein [Streptococcus suis]NQL60059.1 hypothetical protein [Streptococcus suis]NQN92976.1 hypothetical protein [Streptococcus suis]NQN98023.1 hypothetical protein [Streptococcus suis]